MKINKTIYFTVEKELSSDDVMEWTTGLKNIYMYRIQDNKVIRVGDLKSLSDDLGVYFKTSTKEVQDYLDKFYPHYSEWEIEQI